MDELMIHFLMMQMVDQECVAKKQSQTNHINTNPSLNRKKKKTRYKLCHTLYFSQDGRQFLLCEECAHKESRGHDFVFPVFLADFVSYPQVFHMLPLCP